MINPLLHEGWGIEYRVCQPNDTPEIGRLLAESLSSPSHAESECHVSWSLVN
jgi:hypothetical protein